MCRAGLARYPDYLSARVTLARALTELGDLDEAEIELKIVVGGVPDNLAAIRGLAEIHQRRGEMPEALAYYRRPLQLARHDPDLEDTVERISQVVVPQPAPDIPPAPAQAIEDLFDFDSLVQQLGGSVADEMAPLPAVAPSPVAPPPPSVLDSVTLDAAAPDNLATMARQLHDLEEQRKQDEVRHRANLVVRRRDAVVAQLEAWLAAIAADEGRTA